jgi:hypothetical protein
MGTCSSLQLLLFELPALFLQGERFVLGQRNVADEVLVGKYLAAESVRLLRGETWRDLDVEICEIEGVGNRRRRVCLREVVGVIRVRWRRVVALNR